MVLFKNYAHIKFNQRMTQAAYHFAALTCYLIMDQQTWPVGAKIPKAIQMIGRNCGRYTEDDLILDPEGYGGAVLGDSSSPTASNSGMPTSR